MPKSRSKIRGLVATHLLLDLELVDNGSQLGQDLISFLMVLKLGSNEVRKVAEGFRGVKNLFQTLIRYCQNIQSAQIDT